MKDTHLDFKMICFYVNFAAFKTIIGVLTDESVINHKIVCKDDIKIIS